MKIAYKTFDKALKQKELSSLEERIEIAANQAGLKCLIHVEKDYINISLANIDFDFKIDIFYEKQKNYTWLYNFFVRKECRNKGIGTHILKVCDIISKILDVKFTQLKVLETNKQAEDLYYKLGYTFLYKDDGYKFLIKAL